MLALGYMTTDGMEVDPILQHSNGMGRPGDAVIGIIGDYNPKYPTHVATNEAFTHVASPLPFEWVPTATINEDADDQLSRFAGLLIAPGSPYVNMNGTLRAIQFARERKVPLTGT